MHVEIMKAFACKLLKLSSNKVLVLGSIKGAKEPKDKSKKRIPINKFSSLFPIL